MRKMSRRKKNTLFITIILCIFFTMILVLGQGEKRIESEGAIEKNRPEISSDLSWAPNYENGGTLNMTVNMHEGQGEIEIVNEENKVLFQKTFSEGTTKIEPVKLKDFKALTVNTKSLDGEGEYEIEFSSRNSILTIIKNLLK